MELTSKKKHSVHCFLHCSEDKCDLCETSVVSNDPHRYRITVISMYFDLIFAFLPTLSKHEGATIVSQMACIRGWEGVGKGGQLEAGIPFTKDTGSSVMSALSYRTNKIYRIGQDGH